MKYYLHDSNAFNDEKITELFIKFGYEGLGLFYTCLEKFAQQEKPIKTDVLKHQLKVGKKLNKCWNFMESLGLISSNNGETFNKQLLNFSETYKIKKEKNAKRISEWREKQDITKNVTCYESVCNTPKVKRSKVKRSKDILYKEPEWKSDFEIYKQNCRDGFEKLKNDTTWLRLQSSYYKNIDIIKSIEKNFVNYWSTELGWQNKIKSGSTEINWKTTIGNSLKYKENRVYKEDKE